MRKATRNSTVIAVCGLVLIACVLAGLFAGAAAGRPGSNGRAHSHHADRARYSIHLRSRVVTTAQGSFDVRRIAKGVNPTARVHFMLQFTQLPTADEHKLIERDGVHLMGYLGSFTYVASAPAPWLKSVRSLPHARSAVSFKATDKIDPQIRRHVPSWARTKDGAVLLAVRLYDDVSVTVGRELVRQLGGTHVIASDAVKTLTAQFPSDAVIAKLAGSDPVQYVAAVPPPDKTQSISAAAATGAPTIWNPPYGINGAGQTVFVYDGDEVDGRHPDFGGRVTGVPAPGSPGALYGQHATHVGSIVAGSGANSNGATQGGSTTLAFGASAGTTVIIPNALLYWAQPTDPTGTAVPNCVLPVPAAPTCPYGFSWQPGDTIQIGAGAGAERGVIAGWNSTFTGYVLAAPLTQDHNVGDPVVSLNVGSANQYAGVAPGASIYSTNGIGRTGNASLVKADFQAAMAAGATVANMSIGAVAKDCATTGKYDLAQQAYDQIVTGLFGPTITWTVAAANNRPNTTNAGCVNYQTISPQASAKDTITVGALNGDDRTVASFSSFGPTQDGRVKPDISAPGCTSGNEAGANNPGDGRGIVAADFRDLLQQPGGANVKPNGNWDDGTTAPANTPEPYATYTWDCGTSMAAPAVAGAAADIRQDWIKAHGSNVPLAPATIKAILIQTADRPQEGPVREGFVGPRQIANGPAPAAGQQWTWPNFAEGFGQLNLKAAIDLVDSDKNADWIKTDQIAQANPAQTKTYKFYSGGTNDVTATLVWDDPAGPPGAPKELQNQLNLTLTDPSGQVWQPWVANPVNPAAPPASDASTRGVDTLNNVQLVYAPKAAGIWTATVTGTGVTTAQPQKYTLVAPPVVNSISVGDTQANEGDSGTSFAYFTISRQQATDRPQSVSYSTANGTASAGTDYTSASGTATIPAGQLSTVVTVPIIPNTTVDPDRTFTFTISNPQPDQPITRAVATGTILDDDSGLQADIVGKTGQSIPNSSDTITSVQALVSINKKSNVAFSAGTSSTAGTGLFVGNGIDPARLVNPSWTSRRFDPELQLNDKDQLIATDVLAGSPPSRHVRLWDTTTTDSQSNLASGGSFSSSYDAVLLAGLNDNNDYFYLGLSGSTWSIVTNSGSSESYDAVLRPWITNDGHMVYRAGNFTGDATNPPSPIVLDDTGFGSATKIACAGGCVHPGFTQLGRAPTATNDSQIVAFYGALTSQNPQAPQGPGIWASVNTANGRTLVKVAGVGDSGIASFEPTTRVAVNSTQATQRAVTVVFIAYDQAGNKGIYSSIVHLLPTQGQPFDPTNPGAFKVDPPHRIVSVGDRIRGIGPVNDLQVWDPVNDHASGDIAFWVQSATVNAAVRVRSQETPLLFVPGVAGSALVDHANSDEAIWLPSLTHILDMDGFLATHLSLRPEDATGKDIRAKDVLRYILPAIHYGAQYAPILNYLESNGYSEYKLGSYGQNVDKCDTSQLADHPNLFIFPYDWRQSNTVNAARLNSYMQCIQSFYPGDKVNILTHSMGGLLTRRTILAYPSFADKISTLTSVTPPWLGAPKLQYVLMTGDFIPGSISGPGVYSAVQSLPGPQELMPSRSYYSVASGGGNILPFGEAGRNIDGDLPPQENNNELFDYSKMVGVMNFNDPRFQPGTTAMTFHDYSIAPGVGQDDWHNDPFTFQFNELYGVQTDANTIGQSVATTKQLCQTQTNPGGTTFANCRGDQTFTLTFIQGDGTVPEISANRPGSLNPPNAKIIPFAESGSNFAGNADYFEHTGILQNPDVQSQILDILQKNGGPPPPVPLRRRLSVKRAATTANPAVDAPGNEVNVSVYGGKSFVVQDAAGNSTAPVLVDAQPSNIAGTVPNVSTYAIGAHDELIRSFSQSALTTTFKATGGPTEIDVVVGPDAAPTSVTRFMDVNVPADAAVQVASSVGNAPQLQYDSNGDGTVDTTVQPTVAVTGAAAQDVTPPVVSISRVRKTDGTTDVTIAATDSGSGVSDIWYSTDGSTYAKYTGPVNIDPSAVQTLYAFSDDQAGNRSAAANFKVGERVVDTPTALDVLAATDENQALQIPIRGFAPSGEPLTFIPTQPKNGSVTVAGSTISYTPNQYFFGTDTFTFTADDGYLVSEPATVTVTVRHVNQKPVITLTAPQSIDEGATPASITATVWDPDGDTTTLKWSTSLGRLTSNGTSATLAADDGPATATVTLVATDSHGLPGTGQATITVRNVPPKVTVTTPASPYWGQSVSLSGSASDQGPADQAAGLSGAWAFGDGGTGAGFLASHTYAKAGTYTATLTATDKDGGAGTGSAAVTVKKRTSTLAYTGATSAPFGFLTLQAKLTDTVDPGTAQLGGHTVVFVVGTQSFVATTDASGTASTTPAPIAPGSYPVAVTLASNDSAYTATAGRATVAVTRSLGTLTGSSLVFATGGGSGSLSVSSTSTGVTGSFSYTSPTLTVTATSLGPVGISADGHAAWLTGVDSAGKKLTFYLEDNGAGTSDVFKLWVNGVLATGNGGLTAGDVSIAKTG